MQNKIKTYFIFLMILLGLNVVYFYVYFSLLSLRFSFLHLFFIIIGCLSYSIMINILNFRLWRIVSYTVMSLFYFWALMNFAFFKVFKSFVDFGVGQFDQVNINFLVFLKDFFNLVPARLYVVSLIVLVGIIVNSILYFKFIERANEKVLYKTKNLDLLKLKKKKPSRFYKIVALVLLFAFVNFGALGACAYLANSPRISWWQLEEQVTDLGVWGHFYNQVYSKVGADDVSEDITPDETVEVVEKTNLEKTQAIYEQIAELNSDKTKKYSLPIFEEKPNVLIVQLESLPQWILDNDETPMPYLKQLMQSNITVDQFYANSCQTINAEFSSLCSFWPNSEEPISYSHKENDYLCLPSILKSEHGYETYTFHSDYKEFWDRDTLVPKWGFDNMYYVPHYIVKQDDISVFTDAVEVLSESTKPFFGYVLSFSTHSPHNESMYIYNKNANGVDVGPFEGEINKEYQTIELTDKEVRDYLGFMKITDQALKEMMESLEQKGMLENTIVLIYNDHKYYNFKNKDVNSWKYTHQSPFVMVLPQKIRAKIQSVSSHIDIAPTILNLIEQDNYQEQKHFMGQSLFEESFNNQMLNKCLGEVYFVNEDVILRGNAETSQYQVFDQQERVAETKVQRWLDLVRDLVSQSDITIHNNGLLK